MANANAGKNGIRTRFNGNTAAKAGKKGAVKANTVRKEYKSFRECFSSEMTPEMRQQLFDMLVKRAMAGNLKAFEILRDTLGEKPVDHIVMSEVDAAVIDEMEALVHDEEGSNGSSSETSV